MIREGLAGNRILITGVTGFLGQAVFERLLGDVPDARLVLLVRGKPGQAARARAEELLARPVFNRLRARLGADALKAAFEERVEVLEGDVASGIPTLPADLDLVFHCAATVLFDPPIDEGFRTNVHGVTSLYEAIHESGSTPHVVHVSTAYVAGSTKGVVREAPLTHTLDWRNELEAALSARRAVEDQSRKPEMLDRFVAKAQAAHGRAGPQEVAEDAERRRVEWVEKRLVHYGRARAQTVGWPDVYTLTKALGERAAEELAGDLPLSIVRPSIIEGALAHPFPGWIEGFKMADPIILAYGRGAFPEFPGIPDGILDVIPVDLVVNAMLSVAATPLEPGGRTYHHVCSGSRNPLHYRRIYQLVKEYFEADPLPQRDRGHFVPPTWRFPGRRRVEQRLRTGERLLDAADRVLSKVPRSPRVRKAVERLDRTRGRLEFVRRYSDLYGAYVEAEVIYTDDATLSLFGSLPVEDRAEFPFDCEVIDWSYYLKDVHCPGITMALRYPSPRRPDPEVRVRPREHVLAVFDMEGTVVSSNVVESYLWLRLADLPAEEWPGELASVARSMPRYLSAERRDRGEFLRAFYRRYAGASPEELRRLVDEQVADMLLQRVSPPAVRRIRQHREAGHRTILITGAVHLFVEPLRPVFDVIVAGHLATDSDGRYTGYMEIPPLVGEARAAWLRSHALSVGADLASSYAYADSHTDLPLLRAVGNPVAVNPDVALFRLAKKRRWPVEEWHHVKGTPRVLLPEPVR